MQITQKMYEDLTNALVAIRDKAHWTREAEEANLYDALRTIETLAQNALEADTKALMKTAA